MDVGEHERGHRLPGDALRARIGQRRFDQGLDVEALSGRPSEEQPRAAE